MLNCSTCTKYNGAGGCEYFGDLPGMRVCPYAEPKPMTHYDELIRKSPEELAAWVAVLIAPRGDGKPVAREKRILKWLKEEVTDDD